jgi:hypothetical protein
MMLAILRLPLGRALHDTETLPLRSFCRDCFRKRIGAARVAAIASPPTGLIPTVGTPGGSLAFFWYRPESYKLIGTGGPQEG